MKQIKLLSALALLALLAGCSNVLNAPETPAEKRGTVTFTVDQGFDGAARAVYPSLSQFSKVALSFASLSTSPAVEDAIVPAHGSVTISLPVGSWTVAAEAYIGGTVAAQSTGRTIAWDGTNDIDDGSGGDADTRFILAPVGGGNGTLDCAITPPPGIVLGADSRIEVVNLSTQSTVYSQSISGAGEESESIPSGRYAVDIVLVDDATGNTAVYHRTVVILSGLTTEIRFEPAAAEFLSEAKRAALSVAESLEFAPTTTNTADILVDSEDFANGNIAISAPKRTTELFFTVSNPDGLTLSATGATWVSDGSIVDGSTTGVGLTVFKVDTNAIEMGGDVTVTVAAAQEGREAVPITVTVTVAAMGFGLYTEDAGGELTPVDDTLTDLNAVFGWLQTNVQDNTSYVILLDRDAGMTNYRTKGATTPTYPGTYASDVTVTLRGLGRERIVTYDGGSYSRYSQGDGLFFIGRGTTFVLGEHITLDGQNTPLYFNYGDAMVNVFQHGKFIMKPGSKITRTTITSETNGAVRLNGVMSTHEYFTMEGGSISGNNAIAVGAFSNVPVTVLMEDGQICDNSFPSNSYNSYVAAMVLTGTGSSFTMQGGKISGNSYRGVRVSGASVFSMVDGEISYNGAPTMSGPYGIDNPYSNGANSYVVLGAGVFLSGSEFAGRPVFNMTGGKIVGNGTTEVFGSGVFVHLFGNITLDGPVSISGNSVNVWSHSTGAINPPNAPNQVFSRSPIVIGASFSNANEENVPITLDMTMTTYGSTVISSKELIFDHWTAAPALPLLTDVSKLGGFRLGKVGSVYNQNNLDSFTIYANSYTIDPATGVLVSIP
jgi:hypothetical protein